MKSINPRIILPFLQQLQFHSRLRGWMAIVGGGLLSLVGPFFITLVSLLFSDVVHDHGFWGGYCIVAAWSLPILFGIAYLTSGSVMERWMPDLDTDSFGGRAVVGRVGAGLFFLEIANIGPRLVLWGIRRLRGLMRVGTTKLGRAAQCVDMLTQADGGISPAKLLFPEESPDQLEPLLAFLLFHQIADLSKRGDRVWLCSDMRDALLKFAASAKGREIV